MRLADPHRSRAVLMGTSVFRSPELQPLPAVANNLAGMYQVLTDPALGGLLPDRCTTLHNAPDLRALYRHLRAAAADAEDTFLIYYAGHGLTGPRRHELYLTLTDTEPDELRVTALEFELISELFGECPAANRVLILDCCYSGRAAQPMTMAGDKGLILGQIDIAGTYTLTSSPANTPSLAPPGELYTAFTGELLSLLRAGIPGGPELLTLGTLYRRLHRTMALHGHPLPSQRGTDTAELLALSRNPAAHLPAVADVPPPQPVEQAAPPPPLTPLRKRGIPYYALRPLIWPGLALLPASLISRFVGGADSYGTLLVVLWWAWLAVLFVGLARAVPLALKPFRLQVDRHGMEMTCQGRAVALDWGQIAAVKIEPRGHLRRPALCVRPAADGSVRLLPASGRPPYREHGTGWIVLCYVKQLRLRPEEVRDAVIAYGGQRWRA